MVVEVRSGLWTHSCLNASNLDCKNLVGRQYFPHRIQFLGTLRLGAERSI